MEKTRQRIINALENRQPFRNSSGSFFGVEGKHDAPGRPYLNEEALKLYQEANPVYTVVSWHTPIAWITSDGEIVIPDIRYSHSTTVHQNVVRGHLK